MNFIVWMIVGAEISFWLILALGLVVRYGLNKKRLSVMILALIPVVDLVLLTATAVDINNGATAGLRHALAAVYIGVSIAFGKGMIAYGDRLYRTIIMKERHVKAERYGIEYALHFVKGSLRHLAAYLIGCAILWLMIFYAGEERTEVLRSFMRTWAIVLIIDFIIAGTYFIWPKKMKNQSPVI